MLLGLPSPISASTVRTFAPGAAVARTKAVGRTRDLPVANWIRSWRVSGTPPVRCNATSEDCTPSFLTSSTVRPLKEATSTPVSSSYWTSRTSRHCGISHCCSRSKEAVVQALGAIYSRTKEAIRENISGKHIDLTQQGNCLRQSLALQPTLAITRFNIRRNRSRETFRLKSNLIRDRHILHFSQSKKTFRIGKLSHSLALSFLWFWAFQGNKQCTCSHDKQSASLYNRQDSIDMLHSLTQGHAHTAIGIRSSCTQSLGVDFSPTTPREALARSARRVQ